MSNVDGLESDNGRGATGKEEAFSTNFRKLLLPMDRLEAWKTDKEIVKKRSVCRTKTIRNILILVELVRAGSEHGLCAGSLADPRFADCSGAEPQIPAKGLRNLVDDLKDMSCNLQGGLSLVKGGSDRIEAQCMFGQYLSHRLGKRSRLGPYLNEGRSCQIRLGTVSRFYLCLKNPSHRKPGGADGRGSQGKAGKGEQTDTEVDLLSHRVMFELPVCERRD